MTGELEAILTFIRDNQGTIRSFPRVFRTSLEYIQFLSNDLRDITALHNVGNRHINRDREPTAPCHAQHERLNKFRDLLCHMADAIEANKSGRWGDTTQPAYAQAYQDRKAYFEGRMEHEWKVIQMLLRAEELQHCWSIN